MDRAELERLIQLGLIPANALQDESFDWESVGSEFGNFIGQEFNFESQTPFYPTVENGDSQFQLDVWATPTEAPGQVQAEPDDSSGGYIWEPAVYAPSPAPLYSQNDVGALSGVPINSQTGVDEVSNVPLTITQEVYAPDVGASVPQIQPMGETPMPFDLDFSSIGGSLQAPNDGGIFTAIEDIIARATGGPQPISGGYPMPTQTGQTITVNARACPPGMHVPKTYGKRGGSTKPCVSNRHMNPLNPKALARATRRLAGFQTFATKTEKVIRSMFTKAGVHPTRRIGGKCGTCKKTRCSCG